MCKVDFFIIGAPKCGTSSLAQYLGEHQQIFFSIHKEPRFFSTDLVGNTKYNDLKTLDQYHDLFNGSKKNQILGEGSTTYLFSKDAVPAILDYNPNAKFIVMLRNPVDMVQSWHSQKVFENQENIEDFKKAWELQEARQKGQNIPNSCREPQFLQYRKWALFGEQIQRLFSHVDREQVNVILFDDFIAEPRKIYVSVLDFLGIPDDGKIEFDLINPNKFYRYRWLHKFRTTLSKSRKSNFVLTNSHKFLTSVLNVNGLGIQRAMLNIGYIKKQRALIDDKLNKLLQSYFSSDIALLSTLIDRDLSCWQ